MDHIDINPSAFIGQKDRLFYKNGSKNPNLRNTVGNLISSSTDELASTIGRLDMEESKLSPSRGRKEGRTKKKGLKTVSEVSGRLLQRRHPNPQIKHLLREIKHNEAKMNNMVSLR